MEEVGDHRAQTKMKSQSLSAEELELKEPFQGWEKYFKCIITLKHYLNTEKIQQGVFYFIRVLYSSAFNWLTEFDIARVSNLNQIKLEKSPRPTKKYSCL